NSFDKALKITPNDAIILKNKDLALEKLVDQNRLKDSNALALGLNNNGIGYFKQGKYTEAINSFDQALRLTPNDVNIKNNRENAQKQIDQLKNKSSTRSDDFEAIFGLIALVIGGYATVIGFAAAGAPIFVVGLAGIYHATLGNKNRESPTPTTFRKIHF